MVGRPTVAENAVISIEGTAAQVEYPATANGGTIAVDVTTEHGSITLDTGAILRVDHTTILRAVDEEGRFNIKPKLLLTELKRVGQDKQKDFEFKARGRHSMDGLRQELLNQAACCFHLFAM